MRKTLGAVAAIALALGTNSFGHRLDEYLQATLISIQPSRVEASMRLVPGVAVFSRVFAGIDTNADGVISASEKRAYAERVLSDLSLSVDGKRIEPRLASVDFPEIGQMKEGMGEILIEFSADLPGGGEGPRKLVFEDHHQSRVGVYLVNCLAPSDPNIRVVAQMRNENQSYYRLDYVQTGRWSRLSALLGSFGNMPGMFRLGVRHIAEGTDHLLFLLALLLPAPLMATGTRWAGFAGVRRGLAQILKIVTAFTAGHSITLALAALGVVRVPNRPIELLIAVSILVSAVHALRPIFPGREAAIAAFFGLIHGLAFAATLSLLGLGRWERVASLLGFNLGIEAMQLIVVAATMPSLLLLSRTRAYSFVRAGGALFAGLASLGWIIERALGTSGSVDLVVNSVAHHATWIASVLFVISFVRWRLGYTLQKQTGAT